jgi:hypothetical protein
MKDKRQPQGPLCIVLVLLAAAPARPDVAPALTIASPSVATPLSGVTAADAGLVDAADQTDAVHVYTLTNATNAPLSISGVRGACGCENMALVFGGREQGSLILPPGQTFEVRLGVRIEGQPSGVVSKGAWVLGGPSGVQTLASLTLTFRVRQSVTFEPSRLDIGEIPVAGTAAASIALHVDKMPDWKTVIVPSLDGDSPTITAVQVGDPIPEVRDGKPGATIHYRLTLSHFSILGSFTATVRTVWPASAGTTLPVFALPVSYRVVGDLAVTPQAVYFGAVAKGVSVARSLLVIGTSVDVLKAVSVTSPASWLTVRGVSAEQPCGSGASGVLTVVLAKDAPAGSDQSLVTVRAANGETIQIPVTAFVEK